MIYYHASLEGVNLRQSIGSLLIAHHVRARDSLDLRPAPLILGVRCAEPHIENFHRDSL